MIDDKDFRNDLEYMTEKFERDGLPVPEALSEDSMREKLAQTGSEISGAEGPAAARQPGQKPRKKWLRPLIAAAACAALVIALIPILNTVLDRGPGGDPDAVLTADATGLHQFKSYKELDREMKSLLPKDSDLIPVTGLDLASNEDAESSDVMSSEQSAPAEALGESAAEPKASAGTNGLTTGDAAGTAGSDTDDAARADSDAPQHSSTYTQVEDIDEADIVKTDGKYIYYLSSAENQVIIAKASNGKAKRVSSAGGSGDASYINDIYINGDQLIVIGTGREDLPPASISDKPWGDHTIVTIYDISDRTAPKKLSQYSQTGFVLSSRLIGDHLCLVTNDVRYVYDRKKNLPYVSYDSEEFTKLPIENISCFPRVDRPAFTVIGMMDLSSGKVSEDTVKTKAVLGGSDEIYCNGNNLYITGSIYTEQRRGENGSGGAGGSGSSVGSGDAGLILPFEDPDIIGVPEDTYWQLQTQVLKVSLKGGKVTYHTSAIVPGTVNNQFSMDESNGTFKIATTSDHNGSDVNNLFILDDKMREVGSCIGFARDEHIEAVRYIKDKAYVITYEQTDPLFIIDLADPTRPVIEGHVKISGFSTLLVPADDDHLLGLGFSTETTEFGEATDGVKLALFDISDPSAPAVSASKEYPLFYSPVQYDHKALLVGPNADYYAIPYEKQPESWSTSDDVIIEEEDVSEEEDISEEQTDEATAADEPTYGILVFSAKAGQLHQLHDLKTQTSVNRCIFIGNYIYGICSDDSIEGFRID